MDGETDSFRKLMVSAICLSKRIFTNFGTSQFASHIRTNYLLGWRKCVLLHVYAETIEFISSNDTSYIKHFQRKIVRLPLLHIVLLATRVLSTLALISLLSGCAIPYSVSDSPSALSIPEDLRSSKDEVVVLVQSGHSRVREFGPGDSLKISDLHDVVDIPIFMPSDALSSLNKTLKLESENGVIFIFAGQGGGGAALRLGSKKELHRVCILTQNGRFITAFPNDDEKAAPYETLLALNRRDAIISALQEDTDAPFTKIDGPCGISGQVNWPKETRTRIINFLSRMAVKQVASEDVRLVEILSKAKTDIDVSPLGAGSGMLLISTSLRGRPSIDTTIYFLPNDFKALKDALITSDATKILTLLPSNASGKYALENLSLEFLLAVSGDGRVLSWSKERRGWRGVNENPFDEEWKPDLIAVLNQLQNENKLQAHSFIDHAHVPRKPLVPIKFIEQLKSITDEKEVAEGRSLLLSVYYSEGSVVVQPLFLKTSDVPPLITSIKLLQPRELAGLLPYSGSKVCYANVNLSPGYICIISQDGRVIQLEPENTNGWSKPKYSYEKDKWRNEAIGAVLRNDDYHGWFVCSLERTSDWPKELRLDVVDFLKTVTTGKEKKTMH